VKYGISVINKIYRTSAINGIIGFIEILSPINFSLVVEEIGLLAALEYVVEEIRPAVRMQPCLV
jgi:hypothetical protein